MENQTTNVAGSASVQGSGESAPAAPSTVFTPEVKEAALHALAKEDNVETFVAEKRAQETEKRGEPLSDEQRAQRAARYRKAVELNKQALAEGGDDRPQPVPAALEDAQHGETRPINLNDHENRIRKEERFKVRAQDFAARNPYAAQDIDSMFEIFEPASHVVDTILNSDVGPEIAHELAKVPDAILELNDLPREEVARILGVVEGRVRAKRFYEEGQAPTPQRRQTQAPPPLTQLSGGATPSRSLNELAKSDNIEAYAAARRAQAKAAGRTL